MGWRDRFKGVHLPEQVKQVKQEASSGKQVAQVSLVLGGSRAKKSVAPNVEALREFAEERAAIMEYDGILPEGETDRLTAFLSWVRARRLTAEAGNNTDELVHHEPAPLDSVGILPCLPTIKEDGALAIPFNSHPKYHWWRGGQSISKTIADLDTDPGVIEDYVWRWKE